MGPRPCAEPVLDHSVFLDLNAAAPSVARRQCYRCTMRDRNATAPTFSQDVSNAACTTCAETTLVPLLHQLLDRKRCRIGRAPWMAATPVISSS